MHEKVGGRNGTQDKSPRKKTVVMHDTSVTHTRMKLLSMTSLLVLLVVVAEIMLLGKLDIAKNVAFVDSWTHSFYPSSSSSSLIFSKSNTLKEIGHSKGSKDAIIAASCEEWLEKADALNYTRDFRIDPIVVAGSEKDWRSCSVGCRFGSSGRKLDAGFGLYQEPNVASVLRSMESSHYYPENSVSMARGRGYDVVMTTSLSSDVPVGYFSWAEYDIMAPVTAKTEKSIAAAFISNCGANNFRLEALTLLEKLNITIDSYGACHRNRDGAVDKVETLKRYKFSLAFENSNEEDYVTEKFFQSLVAGAVPVVIGAPNIQDFAPFPGSVLHISELRDVPSVAKSMIHLSKNLEEFHHALKWKEEGPTDSFRALVDMAAVHSSCRLCIHLATKIQEREENTTHFPRRPCSCTRGARTVYHLFVRERGRFKMVSVFLRSNNLTLQAMKNAILQKFRSLKHVPVWMDERPKSLRALTWKVYKIYPVGITQKEALFTFKFDGDHGFRQHVERVPCAKFEVIFV